MKMIWGSFMRSRSAFYAALVFLVALIIPTIIAGSFYYQSFNTILTNQVYLERQTVVALSASAIRIKIDQLAGLAHKFAADADLKKAMSDGQWGAGIGRVKDLLD